MGVEKGAKSARATSVAIRGSLKILNIDESATFLLRAALPNMTIVEVGFVDPASSRMLPRTNII